MVHKLESIFGMDLLEAGNLYLRRTSATLTPEEQEHRAIILKNDLLLHEAVIKNDAESVRTILQEPCDVNSRNNYGRAPIHWAAARGNVAIMEMLILAKCDIEVRDKFGMKPILMAAWHGHKDAVQMLISCGACVNVQSKKKHTLLICAAKNKRHGVVEFLLETLENLEVNVKDEEGLTALHHACIVGHVDIVRNLVDAGATIHLANKVGKVPIHSSCENGHVEVVEYLLGRETNIEIKDEQGNTPLLLATMNQFSSLVKLLLESGADPDAQNEKGLTSLHIAAKSGSRGIFDLLLQIGCSLNKQCNNGNTALHFACQANEIEIVEILIEKGCDLNCLNNRLQSPIHIGAEMGHTEICRLLLCAGADIEKREQSGKTPLYIAARGSFTAIVDMIIRTSRWDYPGYAAKEMENDKSLILNAEHRKLRESSSCERSSCKGQQETYELFRDCLWQLAYKQLKPGEWKRLALHWAFTEEQIKAIEHQYTGPSSFKEHGFRMLLIWLHGLRSDVDAPRELYDSLMAIGKKSVADTFKRKMEQRNSRGAERKRYRCKVCTVL